ncbi:MAG TPA: hypothetical protein ENN76_03135 [Euryarchaeota archaeon]|nr:hypothetical protein [Euryarchaeota archaeon]
MLTETSELVGLEVYTHTGLHLGAVEDLVFETNKDKVYGLYIEKTNPTLVEHSISVVVPFRWIEGVGDVIILRYFPGFINSDGKPEHLPFLRRLGKEIEDAERGMEMAIHDVGEAISHKTKAPPKKEN